MIRPPSIAIKIPENICFFQLNLHSNKNCFNKKMTNFSFIGKRKFNIYNDRSVKLINVKFMDT